MAVTKEGGPTHFYEEIEPFCRWRRTEDVDIVELHLPSGTSISKFMTNIFFFEKNIFNYHN